jgi:hypothetical protein
MVGIICVAEGLAAYKGLSAMHFWFTSVAYLHALLDLK